MSDVQIGQLWVDNDPRAERTRYLFVTDLESDRAVCESWYDEINSTSRTVRIKTARFKPTSNGYRLATDQERASQEVPG